jgi:hypothetical protein
VWDLGGSYVASRMSEHRASEERAQRLEQLLEHPTRRRILLGLRAEGPMSPADLSRSEIGRGIRVEIYSYHFKELHRWGLLEIVDRSSGEPTGNRYTIAQQISQSVIDAAALAAISEVLAGIPGTLAQWIEGPYVKEISELVRASGRPT